MHRVRPLPLPLPARVGHVRVLSPPPSASSAPCVSPFASFLRSNRSRVTRQSAAISYKHSPFGDGRDCVVAVAEHLSRVPPWQHRGVLRRPQLVAARQRRAVQRAPGAATRPRVWAGAAASFCSTSPQQLASSHLARNPNQHAANTHRGPRCSFEPRVRELGTPTPCSSDTSQPRLKHNRHEGYSAISHSR